MSKQFKIYIDWQGKRYPLDCDIYYDSSQIQRIKVSFNKKSFSLQNNYPLSKAAVGKRLPIQWKLIEGSPTDARFLSDVMSEIEFHLKSEGKTPHTNPKNEEMYAQKKFEENNKPVEKDIPEDPWPKQNP